MFELGWMAVLKAPEDNEILNNCCNKGGEPAAESMLAGKEMHQSISGRYYCDSSFECVSQHRDNANNDKNGSRQLCSHTNLLLLLCCHERSQKLVMKAVAHSFLDLLFLKSENLARKAVENIVRYLGLRQVARYPDVLL